MKQLREHEGTILEVSAQVELDQHVKDLIGERNYGVKLMRVIANNLYKPLREKVLDFEAVKQNFITKVMKLSQNLTLFEDFIEGFKQHKELLYLQQ
jgi:hypothetical protein